jgi:hypothetical protein
MNATSIIEINEQLKAASFTGDVLVTVMECAELIGGLDEEIEKKEKELQQIKDLRRLVDTRVIPGLLSLAHTKTVELDNGAKVSYKEVVYCSLPKEDQEARARCLAFLSENGAGHLIKDQITVESPTAALIEDLTGKYRIERIRDIHPASLKSWMSEALGVKENSIARLAPDEVPQELHLYIENKTTIKESRKKGN